MRQGLSALPKRLLLAGVRGYRYMLSPWLGSACRFEPTCSAYALGALETHGAALGTYLTLQRLGRCHPWCRGGFDPVPADVPRLFASLFRRRVPGAPPPTSVKRPSP